MVAQEPDVTQIGTLINNFPTCIFASRPYQRLIIAIHVQNSISGKVTIYRGTVSGAFSIVDSSFNGGNNTLTRRFILPAGQGIFVVWDNTGSGGASDAFARMSAMREGV